MGAQRKAYKLCARIVFVVYTEIKQKNGRKYFYRVRSMRKIGGFKKKRVYLGVNLSGNMLLRKEGEADKKLLVDGRNRHLDKIKSRIVRILKRGGVKRAGIFGSYARGEQKRDSDIDILIEPPKKMGFGFVGIQLELQNKLGKKVDLLSYNGISPYLKDEILKQEVRII